MTLVEWTDYSQIQILEFKNRDESYTETDTGLVEFPENLCISLSLILSSKEN